MNPKQQSSDATHMTTALALARKSTPSPNPRVGAVIVKGKEVVGTGFHKKQGAPHAEINALEAAGSNAEGATLYVTLEPCCHHGNTGPCVEAIGKAGISRVVVGMVDPDTRVMGKGIEWLKTNEIKVDVGVLTPECEELLKGYVMHRMTGRPLITLKAAITLDGYIATKSLDSKWISSDASRTVAHQMRSESDAVLVGVQTVIHDNPSLTVRLTEGQSPARVIVDSSLRTPLDAKLIKTAEASLTYVAYSNAPSDRIEQFEKREGVHTVRCKSDDAGQVELEDLVRQLGGFGIMSLLVEGGGKIHGSFTKHKLADRLALFAAPRIIGSGIPWNSFSGTKSIADGIGVSHVDATPIGDDLLIRAQFIR